ncbi:unannotated protein [freshwater metagenome]|uniref:Unannotated protein n=1 Tax=freshwater metagenome TaxID=449393 RepID=A0A6J7SBM6_9ZZZZ
MTSPVERISGPSNESTPLPSFFLNRFHGKTASFTLIPWAIPSPLLGSAPSSRRSAMDLPKDIAAAHFANEIPVALLTKGTVLEALGLASKTYKRFSAIAN